MILILLFYFNLQTQAQDVLVKAPPSRIAKLYAIGKTNEAPIFILKTNYEITESSDDKDKITAKSVITDAKNNVVLTEVATYIGSKLYSQKLEQIQSSMRYEVENKKDIIHYSESKIDDPADKAKITTEKYKNNFILGPVVEAYLAEKTDLLLKGESVNVLFGVPDLSRSFGFDFKLIENGADKKPDIIKLSMQPSNYLIRLMSGNFTIEFNTKTKRYHRFVGRTPLFIEKNSKLEPFDSEIIYE